MGEVSERLVGLVAGLKGPLYVALLPWREWPALRAQLRGPWLMARQTNIRGEPVQAWVLSTDRPQGRRQHEVDAQEALRQARVWLNLRRAEEVEAGGGLFSVGEDRARMVPQGRVGV